MSETRRRRLSASGRVALAMLLALAAAIGSLTLIAYLGVRRSLSTGIDEALVRESDAYSAAMRGAPDGQALEEATRVYLGARTQLGLGPAPILAVIFAPDHVISNSEIRLEGAGGNVAAREPTSATTGLETLAYRGTQYRLLSSPVVTSQGVQIGLFQAALTTTQAQRVATQVAATLGVTGIIVLLFGSGLSLWAAHRSLAPLRSMADDAAAITHARPGTRIEYDGPPDELGTLARSLNSMLDRLEGAFGEQRRFVADASHELRTPLAIIRGNAELVRSGKTTSADADEALKMIDDEARRMTRLVEDLLALARLQSGYERHFQLLEVSALLFEATARVRNLGDRDVSIECPAGIWVRGDLDLLDQALLNITRNAYAHTSEGGQIRLTCTTRERNAVITIADDGPGIPVEDVPRLFDRFYRGHGPRPSDSSGSGLGLAITKRLIELHDGTIRVGNIEPHGAVFTIELPLAQAPSNHAPEA